jgi:hypothetical protein
MKHPSNKSGQKEMKILWMFHEAIKTTNNSSHEKNHADFNLFAYIINCR